MRRILVVDDDSRILEVVAFLLRREGHEVHLAGNGQEAVDVAAEVLPELILLDVMMPEVNGFAACKRIKEIPELGAVPVIFLTAKTGPQNWTEADRSGAVAYIEKPFRNDALIALVREVLDRRPEEEK